MNASGLQINSTGKVLAMSSLEPAMVFLGNLIGLIGKEPWLRLIDLRKTFDIIFSLTQGRPGKSTETLFTYSQSFQYFGLSGVVPPP